MLVSSERNLTAFASEPHSTAVSYMHLLINCVTGRVSREDAKVQLVNVSTRDDYGDQRSMLWPNSSSSASFSAL